MLSIGECRKYLSDETSGTLSDHEVMALRDALYGLAGLAVETMRRKAVENPKSRGEADDT